MIKKISIFLLPVLITFIGLELLLSSLAFIKQPTIERINNYVQYDWPYSSKGWAYQAIMHNPKDLKLEDSKLYTFHATRGWTFKPNLNVWIDGYQWRTNAFGHRSLSTPSKDSAKTKVMILGDSQTAGDEVDDLLTWPNLLAQSNPGFEVINLSVSGYSFAQMYLTFMEEYERWQPDVVIFAVIGDDLYRSALTFRTAQMPAFELTTDNQLKLTPPQRLNNQGIQQAYFSHLDYGFRKTKTWSLLSAVYDRAMVYPKDVEKAYALNHAMLKNIIQKTAQQPVQVFLAYLPYPYEVQGNVRSLEPQFKQLCQDFATDLECVNVRNSMTSLEDFRQGGGHYHHKGNQVVAQTMAYQLNQETSLAKR